jgi:hypothetical protein
VAEKGSTPRVLASFEGGVDSLCWSPDGREVMTSLTSHPSGQTNTLMAFDLRGRSRAVRADSSLSTLQDATPDGRFLWEREQGGSEVFLGGPDQPLRRIPGGDNPVLVEFSADGRKLLLADRSPNLKSSASLFSGRILDVATGAQTSLGKGRPQGFSPDGAWVLMTQVEPRKVLRVPLALGLPQEIRLPGENVDDPTLRFGTSAEELLVPRALGTPQATLEGVNPATGRSRVLVPAPEFAKVAQFLQDATEPRRALLRLEDDRLLALDLASGATRSWPAKLQPGDQLVALARDGSVVVRARATLKAPLFRLDPATGRRTPLMTLEPSDPSGVLATGGVALAPDLRRWALGLQRFTESNLFVVRGLR